MELEPDAQGCHLHRKLHSPPHLCRSLPAAPPRNRLYRVPGPSPQLSRSCRSGTGVNLRHENALPHGIRPASETDGRHYGRSTSGSGFVPAYCPAETSSGTPMLPADRFAHAATLMLGTGGGGCLTVTAPEATAPASDDLPAEQRRRDKMPLCRVHAG